MFIGWRVVAGAFLAMVMANGLFTYGFTVLVDPLREDFGASLEQVMYSLTLGTLFGLALGPIVGAAIDRYSIRLLMTLGCIVMGVGLYLVANTHSIAAFNLSFGVVMTLSMMLMSSMPGSAAVSRWFSQHRGKALGIAAMGTSLGGVIVPALLSYWVNDVGWRGALQNLGLCSIFIVAPFVWLTIRNRPEELGLYPDGSPEPPAEAGYSAGEALTMGRIIRMPAFWFIAFSMGLVFSAFSSMLANLSPYAARLGVEQGQISMMIAVLSMGGLVGKLVFGTAADRINLKVGLWLAHGLLLIAFALLLIEPPYWLLLVAAAFFGLSTGGLLPVWNAMVARVFGVNSFGRAMGAMGPVITLCIMPGYAIVGRLFDSTGSYSAGLEVFSVVIILAGLMLVPLRLSDATR